MHSNFIELKQSLLTPNTQKNVTKQVGKYQKLVTGFHTVVAGNKHHGNLFPSFDF